VVNPLDDAARETFRTGRPLEDSPDMSVCAHCNKSVLKSSLKAHMKACLSQQNKKKEKLMAKEKARLNSEREREREKEKAGPAPLKVKKVQLAASAAAAAAEADGDAEDDDDAEGDEVEAHQPHPPKKTVASGIAAVAGGIKAAKKSAGKNTGGGDGEKKQGKKRKAEAVDAADSSKGPKAKKKKEEPKPKAPKPKGPVDVERQCGVMTPNGVPCARSLTCKSHSMGAKRAVAGRSLPYDMLLAAYQKKNQAKQQSMLSLDR
jgi:SAGA-associated factor 73